MTQTISSFWDALQKECNHISRKGFKVSLDASKYNEYENAFQTSYKEYKNRYMKEDVEYLDRHKVASILVIEGIALNLIIAVDNVPPDKIFLGKEKILLSVALRFLVQQFNRQIVEAEGIVPMDQFELPKAFSCKTGYDDIMARIQYFSQEKYGDVDARQIAEMELADRFFLLEYISIINFYKDKAENVFKYLRKGIEEC